MRRQPVTEQALPARLHGLCSIMRQIGVFLGTRASWQLASCNANCLQSPKALHTQKNLSFPMQRNLSNQQKKSCFCVVIRLKTSQNKKNMQPFTSYQDKSVVLDTPSKIPRLNRPIFPHTVEILYLFGILRINTRGCRTSD